MLHHFKIIPFIGGLFIGWLMLMYFKTPPLVLYQYPHPQTIDNTVYKDKIGTCYTYSQKVVDCDKNEGTLRPYPLQG